MRPLTYVEIIALHYPTTNVWTVNDGLLYSDLRFGDPANAPSQQTLDTFIRENSKEKAWRLIQAERDRRKSGGVTVNGFWFHSDDASRIQYIALMMLGQNMPQTIMWKTMSGAFVLMTPTLVASIFNAVMLNDQLNFANAEQHRFAMYNSPAPLAYNYTSGWTTIYGE